jgi:hypothetical protein
VPDEKSRARGPAQRESGRTTRPSRRAESIARNGHFHWNELLTGDVEGAKRFYGAIFGWQFEGMSMPDGTYWV